MKPMNKVTALRGCSVFGAMSFTAITATATFSELRHRRHRAAMRGVLQLLVAQSCQNHASHGMSCEYWRLLCEFASRSRKACVMYVCSSSLHTAALVIPGMSQCCTGVSVLCCSAAWAVPVGFQVKNYRFFFLIAIVRTITFLTGLSEAKLSNRSLRGENPGHKLTPFLPE